MPPQDTTLELIAKEKSIISGLLTDSTDASIVLNNEGWDNRVYIVNQGEYVFKFPRSEEIRDRQAKEIAAIRILEDINTTVSFPKIAWTHKDHAYFAYTGIKGKSLLETIESLNSKTIAKLGGDIGNFLKQLHAKNLDQATNVSIDDEIKWYQEKYHYSLDVISKRFNTLDQEKIKQFALIDLPNTLKQLGSTRRLCHGDLGTYNMILDEDNNLGIIDFGDTNYYDQSKDFIGLSSPILLNAALQAYGDTKLLRDKIEIRRKANRMFDLPYYITKDDKEGLEQGLKVLAEELLS
jgi:aminoglycoside phosphotransferase (APT) family kinase protein